MEMKHMLSIQAEPDVQNIRTAQLFDQAHTVIPAVVLVEGVLWPANAPAPELALAEEFGRFPDGWNGRPVVFDHPRVDGLAVSASSPDVLEVNSFGQLFNTRLDGTKLKTEIWINNARVQRMSEDAREVIDDLLSGKGMAEVSTGLFTMNEMVKGTYKGQEYEAVWRNIVPDHLAVLPKGIKGACSVEDGCGAPRMNAMKPVMRAAALNTQAESRECACEHMPTEEDLNMLQKFTSWCSNVLSVGTVVVTDNADGMAVSADTEVTEIVPEATEDEPTSNIQENAMNREELVNELIANEATQFNEEDREWLTALEEAHLSRMVPVVASAEESTAGDDTDSEGEQPTAAPEAPTDNSEADAKPVSTQDYIDAAPDEIRQVLNAGLRMHRDRKGRLVKALTANKRCRFTQEQLEAKDIDELEALSELANDVSYEGNGANMANNAGHEDDDAPPPPPEIFSRKADAA